MRTRLPSFIKLSARLSGHLLSLLLLVVIVWLGSLTQSMAQVINWQKALGGSKNDSVTAILATTDGGYVITGNTTSIDGDMSGFHPFIPIYL